MSMNTRYAVYPACLSGRSYLTKSEFTSVQDGMYALGKAQNYALHPASQKFPQSVLPLTQFYVCM